MKITAVARIIPGLAVVVGAAIALAPLAAAETDPLVQFGTSPHVSGPIGQHTSDQDEADVTNGRDDLPF